MKGLETTFGPIDVQGDAIRRMLTLKQTISVNAYVNAYCLVIPYTSYNQDSIIWYFENGLKESVKTFLVGKTHADTFKGLVRQMAEIKSDITWLKSLNAPVSTSSPKNTNTTMQKDSNAMNINQLNTEEYNRRKREGLCFTKNCGAKDHMIKDCPKRKRLGA